MTKNAAALREAIQTREIDVAAVHHVERARFDGQLVEHVHIVHFPVGNVDKTGDVAAQVDQRVQLDGALAPAKLGPREQAQAQVDGRGVEGVGGLLQFDGEAVRRRTTSALGESAPGRSRRRSASRARLASANVLRETWPRKPA